ncbi:LysR family transcriptional regulator [Luteolibacter pohnpeiensis]|uniref:LysR family transcriptional regulator n=1 Tax=Luteolibacter pohnpeiensis TaxID=454153 RepID=A0A934S9U0_9BACT|nr:LysR family transcriptional regulator [Luteolibacter pohnpeiensis]MBK1884473.1 LysR family transcriptional regulator [Luteolibacter pohnpeiensis]
MDIDFASLLILRRLAETGSFTETGKTWKISQPAVSLMISKLESAMGLVLLERTTTGAKLTSAGELFLQRSNEVCDAYLALIDGMRHIGRQIDREVLVGMDGSWFSAELQKNIPSCKFPDGVRPLIVDCSCDWSEDLESTRCDVIVAGRYLRSGLSQGVQEASIRRERGITVAWNPDFYPFDSVTFSFPDILQATVLLPSSRVVSGFAAFLKKWCEDAYGRQPVNVIQFDSEQEAAEACSAGLGVLVSPGDAMPRVHPTGEEIKHVKTFEFLLPEGFTLAVYCRSDEDSKDVLSVAAAIGKLARRLFDQAAKA